MNRLILLVESRIRGNVYVRFGGEYPKTHRSNTAGRRVLSLPYDIIKGYLKYIGEVSFTAYVDNILLQHIEEHKDTIRELFDRKVSKPF